MIAELLLKQSNWELVDRVLFQRRSRGLPEVTIIIQENLKDLVEKNWNDGSS
jgi:hypothetical protein